MIEKKKLVVQIITIAEVFKQKYGDVLNIYAPDKDNFETPNQKNKRLIKQRQRQQFKRK